MRQFLVTVLGVLTALFIALIVLPVFFALLFVPAAERLPEPMVVELDLSQPLQETAPGALLALAQGTPLTLADLHGGLAAAAADPDVAALFIRGSGGLAGAAQAEEILEALAPFKASGKPVYGFVQDVGPADLADFLVLAQADRLWMQPSGSFLPAGLSLRTAYLRGLLDRLGVAPEFEQFREYKGAADTFTQTRMPEPQREAATALLKTVDTVLTGGIATARGLSREKVVALLEAAPLSADAAHAGGLVDALAYEAAVREQVLADAGDEADFAPLAAYAADRAPFASGTAIAVVHGVGPIVAGEAPPEGPFGAEPVIGSTTMARAIADAAADEDITAILVRIDSPGGSASGSDEVWHAIRAARDKGKPVIASMGSVAASGGYYIPSAADLIVANAATITGSIGIVGGKFALGGLLDELGIAVDGVATTRNADLWAPDARFSPEQRARFRAWLEDGYEDFKARVAAGRGISAPAVEAVAKGRIWAGRDAAERGLVDRIGGFGTALAAVRELAGLAPDAPLSLHSYPRPRSLREELLGVGVQAGAAARALALAADILGDQPVALWLSRLAAAGDARGLNATADAPEIR